MLVDVCILTSGETLVVSVLTATVAVDVTVGVSRFSPFVDIFYKMAS